MGSLNWGDLIKDASDSGNNFEPLPDGDYDLKIIEAEVAQSSSGKTMFKVTTEVQTGAYAKRRVWDNLVVSPDSPNALGFFFSKMKALGLGPEFFSTNPSNSQIEQALNGRTFKAQVGSRTWQGTKRNELKKYYSVGAATAPPQAYAQAPAAAPAPQAAPAPAPAAAPAPAPAPAYEQPTSVSPPSQIGVPAPAPAPAPVAAPPAPPAPISAPPF